MSDQNPFKRGEITEKEYDLLMSKVLLKYAENIEKWGHQSTDILILAINEEWGEVNRAILSNPNENNNSWFNGVKCNLLDRENKTDEGVI